MRGTDRAVVLGLHRTRHERDILETAVELGVRHLDTSYSYLGFGSHRTLSNVASDLLANFHVSTKVGFFSDGDGRAVHSLDPTRLREAAHRSADDLDRVPDVMLLHNPERSLRGLEPAAARELLASACSAMESVVHGELSGAWGIASWDPRPIVQCWVDGDRPALPAMIMCRAGLLASAPVLQAADELAVLCGLPPSGRRGMSPFGGDANHRAFTSVDPRIFLTAGREGSRAQAAFRVAYDLPKVGQVAVGTSDPRHLRQLVTAIDLETNTAMIDRYRRLLAERQTAA